LWVLEQIDRRIILTNYYAASIAKISSQTPKDLSGDRSMEVD